jgi:hypothetical protein
MASLTTPQGNSPVAQTFKCIPKPNKVTPSPDYPRYSDKQACDSTSPPAPKAVRLSGFQFIQPCTQAPPRPPLPETSPPAKQRPENDLGFGLDKEEDVLQTFSSMVLSKRPSGLVTTVRAIRPGVTQAAATDESLDAKGSSSKKKRS